VVAAIALEEWYSLPERSERRLMTACVTSMGSLFSPDGCPILVVHDFFHCIHANKQKKLVKECA